MQLSIDASRVGHCAGDVSIAQGNQFLRHFDRIKMLILSSLAEIVRIDFKSQDVLMDLVETKASLPELQILGFLEHIRAPRTRSVWHMRHRGVLQI